MICFGLSGLSGIQAFGRQRGSHDVYAGQPVSVPIHLYHDKMDIDHDHDLVEASQLPRIPCLTSKNALADQVSAKASMSARLARPTGVS